MPEAVEKFLWDVMGYRGIADLVVGLKPPEQSVKAFLDGTIFRMFTTVTVLRRTDLPFVSKIRPIKEPVYSYGGIRLAEGYGIRLPKEKRQSLEWVTENAYMLRYQTPQELEEFVAAFSGSLFPNADLRTEKQGNHLEIALEDKDFYFEVNGLAQRKSARRLTVAFNASRALVEKINGIVGRYYAMKKEFSGDELLAAFSSKLLDTSGAVVTDAGILASVGKVPDEELLQTLRAAKPPAYLQTAGYVSGALIMHMHHGPGVVIAKEGKEMKAYFPRNGERVTLMTAV